MTTAIAIRLLALLPLNEGHLSMTSNAYGPRKPRKVADTFTPPTDAAPPVEKKQSTTVWVPVNLNKQIRILAAMHDTTQSDLVAEGMRMVIAKYTKE